MSQLSRAALLLTALGTVGPLCHAHAATLRPFATLAGPSVRVSDLFAGAGPGGERILGPAPAPGGRITVGAEQLGAIAQAYGVDWQPHSAADQAVLERPGRLLATEDVTAALRPALVAQGAPENFAIVLPFYDPPVLDAGSAPRLTAAHVVLDVASGRFSALVLADTGTSVPLELRLAGTIEVSVEVVVPTHRLLAGAIVAAADLTVQRLPERLVTQPVTQDPAQAIGLQLRHMEFPGQPVPLADLQHPAVVAKGDRVLMQLALPGLDLGAIGQALAAGAIGERITVRNPASGAVLTAEVLGAGQVRVDPDAPPSFPALHASFAGG